MRKKTISLALALVFSLGLFTVPSIAADTVALTPLTGEFIDGYINATEGLMYAVSASDHYYLDVSGKIVIGPFAASDYFPAAPVDADLYCGIFTYGKAALMASWYDADDELVSETVYIDKTGKVVITVPAEYTVEYPGEFGDGGALALLADGSVLFIEADGKVEILDGWTDYAYPPSEGVFILCDEEEGYYYADKSGKNVFDTYYSSAYPFYEGYAAVSTDAGLEVIDKTGKTVMDGFEDMFVMPLGKAVFGGAAVIYANKACGLMGTDGKPRGEIKWDNIGLWADERFIVCEGKLWGVIDNNGKVVLEPKYLDIVPITNEYAAAAITVGEYVIINTSGEVVSSQSAMFDYISFMPDLITGEATGAAIYSLMGGAYGLLGITGAPPSAWAEGHINQALAMGLVPESLRSNYNAPITRAEFCALAVTLYEAMTGGEITELADFTDTTDLNVRKMGGLDVVHGVGGGRFDPDADINREQSAIMLSNLMRAFNSPLDEYEATFDDAGTISSWAVLQVGMVQGAGIMSGTGNNTFTPKGKYTREQSITTMLKLYDLLLS